MNKNFWLGATVVIALGAAIYYLYATKDWVEVKIDFADIFEISDEKIVSERIQKTFTNAGFEVKRHYWEIDGYSKPFYITVSKEDGTENALRMVSKQLKYANQNVPVSVEVILASDEKNKKDKSKETLKSIFVDWHDAEASAFVSKQKKHDPLSFNDTIHRYSCAILVPFTEKANPLPLINEIFALYEAQHKKLMAFLSLPSDKPDALPLNVTALKGINLDPKVWASIAIQKNSKQQFSLAIVFNELTTQEKNSHTDLLFNQSAPTGVSRKRCLHDIKKLTAGDDLQGVLTPLGSRITRVSYTW